MFWATALKRAVHTLHRLKFRFFAQLEKLDGIPFFVRIPLGVVLLVIGTIFFYIPFINGVIFMIIGARMLGKRFSKRMFRCIASVNHKSFSSAREALLHTLRR